MALQGKGFMIWNISRAESGNPDSIATAAQGAGLTNVMIKIADGVKSFNLDPDTGRDLVTTVSQALRGKGIQVWGWHYVYGNNPAGEAQIAVRRVKELDLDGYIIDAESEFKQSGKEDSALRYMKDLRAGLPNTPIALCSYRYPTYHPQFPWQAFLEKCDLNMPQVYWEKAHNAGAQLERSVKEFQALQPFRPIIPIGPAYKVGDWVPTAEDTTEFLQTAKKLNLASASFFEWYYARVLMKPVWDAVAAFPWMPAAPQQDISELYIKALNTRDPAQISALYHPKAVHITAARTIQGNDPILNWYTSLVNQVLPKAVFSLTSFTGSGDVRHLKWQALGSTSRVTNGTDTIGIVNGKIHYHYTFFTTTPI